MKNRFAEGNFRMALRLFPAHDRMKNPCGIGGAKYGDDNQRDPGDDQDDFSGLGFTLRTLGFLRLPPFVSPIASPPEFRS